MNETELKTLVETLKETVLEAGLFAKTQQGKVKNIGKESENLKGDSDIIKARRDAKTEIDEKVQEMILQTVSKIIDPKKIFLDAEEKTPLVKLFPQNPTNISLVIDPVDGTKEYLEGDDCYSICVGLFCEGNSIVVIVYFPSRDDFYLLDTTKKSYLFNDASSNKFQNPTEIQSTPNHSKIIYTNSRVSDEIMGKLKRDGFEVKKDPECGVLWPDALIKCISGEYAAFIADAPQIRDVLLGAIIEHLKDGYAINWSGNKLIWPESGRIPTVIFGVGSEKNNIINSIN